MDCGHYGDVEYRKWGDVARFPRDAILRHCDSHSMIGYSIVMRLASCLRQAYGSGSRPESLDIGNLKLIFISLFEEPFLQPEVLRYILSTHIEDENIRPRSTLSGSVLYNNI